MAPSQADEGSVLGDAQDGFMQLDPASGPADAYSKLGAKISCLPCRAAKRKCSSNDVNTVCKRCATHQLACEYQRHRRGRKKKPTENGNLASPSSASNSSSTQPTACLVGLAPPVYPPVASTSAVTLDGPHPSHAPPSQQPELPLPPSAARQVNIQFSHVVPSGDSMPFVAGAQNAAPPPAAGPFLPSDAPDPVQAGLLSELDAYELFDFYFKHLNLVVPILDPHLHTPAFAREKSALLFASVLTVTSKVVRPKVYGACVLLSNKLVGQAIEFGLCAVEVVQALNLLTHWKKPDDSSSWRKVGYAIRMAQELRLNVRAPRPLPTDERQAREILNKERAWLNLIVADYHLAIHHSLPRMISEEHVDDPADWVGEHAAQFPTPGESTLAPWITFSRMCRLYADMLAAMNGDQSNLRSLRWLEHDWRRWRSRWLGDNPGLSFLPPQIATLRLCDAYFRFHLAEYKLLFASRYRNKDRPLNTEEPSELSSAFCECVDASLALAAVFQNDFAIPGYLSFCFNLTWVALAVVSVWLVKNIVAMHQTDRDRVIRTLNDIQSSTEDASRSSDDMSAYTHRLISHLLSSVSPAWQLSSLAAAQPSPATLGVPDVAPTPLPSHPNPRTGTDQLQAAQDSAQTPAQLPQYSHLDRYPPVGLAGSHLPWPLATQQIIQENLYAQQQASGSAGNGVGAPGPGGQAPFEVHGGSGGDADAFSALGHAPLGHDDLLFPAADDDIWRLLFPVTDTSLG
ncbi:hypothetical protein JCM3770_006232 [Rhodotorula araucariae]